MANKANLLALADVLESEHAANHFYMGTYFTHELPEAAPLNEEENVWDHHEAVKEMPRAEAIKDCGTVACIAGWAATLANPQGTQSDSLINEDAMTWLELDQDEVCRLFYPWNWVVEFDWVHRVRDPKLAAKVVRNFAETGEINWELAR